MVDAFIGVLTPKSKVTEGAKAKEALLKSVNSKLSQCLHLSFKNTLSPKSFKDVAIPSSSHHNTNNIIDSEFTPRTPSTQCLSNRIAFSTISTTSSAPSTSSSDFHSSPARTRKNRNSAASNSALPPSSPRKGIKAKLRRTDGGAIDAHESTSRTNTEIPITPNSNLSTSDTWNRYVKGGFGFQGRPTTDFLGWRRLHIHEIVRLNEGDFFIAVIPSDRQREDKSTKSSRNNVRGRVLDAVIRSSLNIFSDSHNSKAKKKKRALEYLHEKNGIVRTYLL